MLTGQQCKTTRIHGVISPTYTHSTHGTQGMPCSYLAPDHWGCFKHLT